MKSAREYGGLDRFRLAAALLIVGIHTSPFSSLDGGLDFLLIRVLARVAVPFFLMVTGYFLLGRYLTQERRDGRPLLRFMRRTGLIYAGATVLYLPVSIYAGYYQAGNTAAQFLKNIFFDGTFYHLWYLPASLIGVLLIYLLGRRLSLRAILGIAGALYVVGLLGDSYYGLAARIPFLNAAYNAGFTVFSYTRNGLFYAPVFLALGAAMAGMRRRWSGKICLAGLVVSALLMLAEGAALRSLDLQRHDSMYILLIPCMFFLFQLLLSSGKGGGRAFLRELSAWVYILHPVCIIAVRGAAKVTGLTGLLVENSIVHYLAVCLASLAASALLAALIRKRRPAGFPEGRAWIELNLAHLRHNVNILRGHLPVRCQLMPAVKADAYGHGVVQISRALCAAGVRAFCVASAAEGVQLRRHGVRGEILVLGYTHPRQLSALRRYRLTQTVVDADYAETLARCGKRLTVHIKVDTGMRRLGERSENLEELLRMFSYKNLDITGLYTHLCAADGEDAPAKDFTRTQIERFRRVLSEIEGRGLPLPKTHIQGSYGVFSCPELSCDYARVGIALYGMLSNPEDAEKYDTGLLPVLSLKARIGAVKTVFAGEPVGYGLAFTARQEMKLAVLSVGYADGIPRALSCGVGHVLIRGQKAPVVGRVCMDQMAVDVTGIDEVRQGDTAVVIGRDGEQEITVCEIARQAGTITNEILSRLGARLDRQAIAEK